MNPPPDGPEVSELLEAGFDRAGVDRLTALRLNYPHQEWVESGRLWNVMLWMRWMRQHGYVNDDTRRRKRTHGIG